MYYADEMKADINGDQRIETVDLSDNYPNSALTTVKDYNGNLLWSHEGWIDGWNRRFPDDGLITAGDYDGDGCDEILISNQTNSWTGILKWIAGNLHCPWASASPVDGWHVKSSDELITAQLEPGNKKSIFAYSTVAWTGVFNWINDGLHLAWASPGPIDGWQRRADDQILVLDIDQDGMDESVMLNAADGWIGVFKWQTNAIHTIWASASPLHGAAGDFSFQPGDYMAPGRQNSHIELNINRPADNVTGYDLAAILQWQNNALEPIRIV